MSLQNKIDLMFLKMIWENNSLAFKTKIQYTYFEDVLVRNLYKISMKNINEKGAFFPRLDLAELIEDEERMDKYRKTEYPLEITDAESIVNYINEHNSTSSFQAIEKTIEQRWLRKQLKIIKFKFEEDLIDSDVSSSEILRRYSNKFDNLMYSEDDERIVLSVQEMYDDEIAYQMNEDVDEFYQTGNPLIDKMNGGLNAPSFTCIAGAAKSGKSISLYQIVLECLLQGKTVMLGTIEIPPAEAKRKLYSLYTKILFKKINKKIWDSKEERDMYFEKIAEFRERFNDLLFIYYKKSGFCAKDVEHYCANLEKAGIKIDNIALDYMLIMKSNDDVRGIGGIEFFIKIPKELRILSQKLNARVFSAAQLHSTAEVKEIEKITFDDIYYMKNCAHECTYLIAIKRDMSNGESNPPLLSKIILGRQEWTPEIYHYPSYDYSRIFMGDAVPYLSKENDDQTYWEEI